MPPIASHRTLASLTVLALLVGACSGSGPSASIPPPEAASTVPTARPSPAPESATASSDAWLVVGRAGEPGLEVLLASTLERLYELPSGVPAVSTWGELVATEQRGDETLVNAITVQPDLPARTRAVPGAWRLPTLGRETLPVGVSADGSTVVLVEENPPAERVTTRFAVVVPGEATRTVELPGALSFDALSPDGSILYVVEHLPGPPDAHYQVRAVDLPAGLMRDTIIVDKRNLDEQMGGWPSPSPDIPTASPSPSTEARRTRSSTRSIRSTRGPSASTFRGSRPGTRRRPTTGAWPRAPTGGRSTRSTPRSGWPVRSTPRS